MESDSRLVGRVVICIILNDIRKILLKKIGQKKGVVIVTGARQAGKSTLPAPINPDTEQLR